MIIVVVFNCRDSSDTCSAVLPTTIRPVDRLRDQPSHDGLILSTPSAASAGARCWIRRRMAMCAEKPSKWVVSAANA